MNAIDLRGGKGTRPLPFAVRCDRFTIEFYENGAPKTFRSDLTFLKDNRIIHQGPLMVNHPISIDGLRFYQASYGQAPEGKATLSFLKNGRKGEDKALAVGDSFELPGREGTVHVLRLEENLMQMGPAIKLSVRSTRGETVFWVFRHIDKIREMNPGIIEQVPLFNPGLFSPYVFVLNGMAEKYYTGLQVNSESRCAHRGCRCRAHDRRFCSWFFSRPTVGCGFALIPIRALPGSVSPGGVIKTPPVWNGR